MDKENQRQDQSPIACDLKALNDEQRRLHQFIGRKLRGAIREIAELSEGYALRFEPSVLLVVAEFVSLERLCCPFLDFVLEVEREGGPLWLRLTGRQGVKEFLQTELGIGPSETRNSKFATRSNGPNASKD